MVNEYVSPTPAPTIPSVIVLPWFISCVIALSVVLLLVLGMLSRSSSRKRGSGSSSSIETAPITDNSEGALVYLLQAMLVGTDELRAEPDDLAKDIWSLQKTSRSHQVKKRWVEIKKLRSWEWMANQVALANLNAGLLCSAIGLALHRSQGAATLLAVVTLDPNPTPRTQRPEPNPPDP